MKIRPVLLNFAATLFAVVLACVLFAEPEVLIEIAAAKTMLLTFLSVVFFGPLWTVYSRLNAFDKLDGIDATKREHVYMFAGGIRQSLTRWFRRGVVAVVVLFFILIAVDRHPALLQLRGDERFEIENFVAVWGPAFLICACMIFLGRTAARVLKVLGEVEKARGEISELQLKEAHRKKAIEQLRKKRSEEPLRDDDPQLADFRKLHYSVISAETENPQH